jgi:hypothetical protein
MPKIDQYISDRLAGRPVQEPAGPAPSRDRLMTAALSARLRGQAPGDTNTIEPEETTTSDTPDEADVPDGVDAKTWADAQRAARDPQDPAHAIADALLTVAAALADLKGQQEAQP